MVGRTKAAGADDAMKPKPRSSRRAIAVSLFAHVGVASASLIAISCASEPGKVWVKAGATDADFYRIRSYCVNQAGVGALPSSAAMPHFVACMQSDGWVQMSEEEANQPRFTWLRADGTSAPRAELEAAKKECQASSRDDPSSPFYGPNIMQCVQSKGYQLVEDKQ
jgi:hypothetical protein